MAPFDNGHRALHTDLAPHSHAAPPPFGAASEPADLPLSQQHLQQRQAVFNAVRPHTTQLLALRAQPDRLAPALRELAGLLQELPPAGVAGCWDYIAFPLLLLLDSVVPARQPQQGQGQQGQGQQGQGGGDAVACPAASSDRVVEALLAALLALLRRSPPPDAQQSLGALQRLAPLLTLPRGAVSEEVALGLMACLAEALGPAEDDAEQEEAELEAGVGARSSTAGGAGRGTRTRLANSSGGGGGGAGNRAGGYAAAALREESAAPLAGFVLHCCLEAAEREVAAGSAGSKALCASAVGVVRRLVVGLAPDPDALAFFLPGLMSSLSRLLLTAGAYASHTGRSAPPGAAATVQSLACLRAALVALLGEHSAPTASTGAADELQSKAAHAAPGAAAAGALTPTAEQPLNAEDALSALRALSMASSASPQQPSSAADAPSPSPAPLPTPPPGAGGTRRLRVERSPAWQADTVERVTGLLRRALPPLASHPRPAVRAELGDVCRTLLDACGTALAPCQPLLLRLLFTLSQDEWQTVAAPCMAWVGRRTGAAAVSPAAASATPPLAQAAAGAAIRGSAEAPPAAAAQPAALPAAAAAAAGSGGASAQLRDLQAEFETFMRSLAADSALLDEQPALELDERDLYGYGIGRGAGDAADDGVAARDQGPVVAAAPAALAANGALWASATAEAASQPPPLPPQLPPPPPPPLPGLRALIEDLVGGGDASGRDGSLARAVRRSEADAVVAARCLSTALLVAGPAACSDWLLRRPTALADLMACLFRCFAFDRGAGVLVLHLQGEPGAHAPVLPTELLAPGVTASPPPPPPQTEAASAALGRKSASGTAGGVRDAAPVPAEGVARAAAAGALSAASSSPLLPRMPMGLLHLASQRSYAAVAGVARAVGWLARAADAAAAAQGGAGAGGSPPAPSGGTLRRVVDELVAALRSAVASGAAAGEAAAHGGGAADDSGEEGEEVDGGGARDGAADALGAPGGAWQCEAAAVAAVAAEVVFGASSAWTPPLGLEGQAAAAPFANPDPSYEQQLQALLSELMSPRLTKLPTHNASDDGALGDTQQARLSRRNQGPRAAPSQLSYDDVVHPELAAPRRQRRLSAQALGLNAMLLRCVAEAVGAAARGAGPRFAGRGRLLRSVLVPLLEMLGDPTPPVAASASAALQSICAHCGFGGSLGCLIGRNADFVVDAVAARLRDLRRHPRAPQLLAALLRRAGVAPELLPLMAEPMARALGGLSILARHWAPQHVHAYLAVLRELSAGAASEAVAAAAESVAAVAQLNAAALEARARETARREAAERATSEAGEVAPGEGGHAEAHRYFTARAAAKPRRQQQPAADASGVAGQPAPDAGACGGPRGEEEEEEEEEDGGEQGPLLLLTAAQLDDAERRFRRLHAAAVVAGAAAEAATPLLLSNELRAAVAAADVLRASLGALAAATPPVEAEAAVLEEYGGAAARMRPVRPETPKVLPAVATAWGPLMGALRDARGPLVERALAAVAELVAVAGGKFLARRFQAEAWPVLQRLLARGTAHTPGQLSLGTGDAAAANAAAASCQRLNRGAAESAGGGRPSVSGGEDAAGGLAPAAVARVRVAVLGCIDGVCHCTEAEVAVRPLTWSMAQAALPFLGATHGPAMHEAAIRALLAVAAVDPDGVWMLLYDTVHNSPQAPHAASPPSLSTSGGGGGAPAGPPGSAFAPLQSLLPLLPGAGSGAGGARYLGPRHSVSGGGGGGGGGGGTWQWPVTVALAADCGRHAEALLATVAASGVPWHRIDVARLVDAAATDV